MGVAVATVCVESWQLIILGDFSQNQLNTLFFPVIVKSKRQWARPDRPGVWGQRRDSTTPRSGANPNGLRKMKSESALQARSNSQAYGGYGQWR